MTERVAGGHAPKVQRKRNSHGKRVPAVQLIEEKGWEIGDRLMHSTWKAPRSIEAIEGGDVKMRGPAGAGFSWPASLPLDTYRVDNAA